MLREGQELCLAVPTVPLIGTDTNRILAWAGALIQMPYKAVLEQVSNVPQGVYVSCTLYGSPASTALRPGVWITEIDGIAVSDLDEFLDAVHNHENKVVRSRQGSVCEVALKRLSLAHSSKRLSNTVLHIQHMQAHPGGLPANHSPAGLAAMAAMAPIITSHGAPKDGADIHPHDGAPMHAPENRTGPLEVAQSPCSSVPGSPSMGNPDDAAQSQGYVRIKIQARNGTVSVIAMKLDPIYWSTTQLLPDPESVSGWKMVDVL